jgi:CheY-like chemotaxis protein
MKKLLFVDDDPLVPKLYQQSLGRLGFEVQTAGDGLTAMRMLRLSRADVVILDLLMPRFSGVDVLKFIRADKDLKSLPVIVLSNAYMNEMGREAAALGVQKAILKSRCTPFHLRQAIEDALDGRVTSEDISVLLAVPKAGDPAPSAPPAGVPPSTPPPSAPGPFRSPGVIPATIRPPTADSQGRSRLREQMADQAATNTSELRSLFQAYAHSASDVERDLRMQGLYRKVGYISAAAGMSDCSHLAQMTDVLEALLFDLIARPACRNESVLQTIAGAIDFIGILLEQAARDLPPMTGARVMVVDDDPVCTRLVVSALRQARLEAHGLENPVTALITLQQQKFDLLLVDIEMPQMSGFDFCQKVRLLPGYAVVPLVYVTSHTDFASRARSALTGGNDLIGKPILPLELAVKSVGHLLRGVTGTEPGN